MPYKVEKRGDKWVIINKETGKVKGHSDNRADAMASMRARYAAEAGGFKYPKGKAPHGRRKK